MGRNVNHHEAMTTSSQGSVSTAQAAGSGLPTVKPNKMKLDMPPRPAKTNNRRPPVAGGDATGAAAATNTKGGVNVTGGAPQQQRDGSVPYVVRVTFLGVAGLLANPPHLDGTALASDGRPITASPAANHPSLLFPLPPYLKVVASVSRSRTARGIPSGMSKCLAPSGGNQGNQSLEQKQKPPSLLSPSSTTAMAGSFALSPVSGENIVVEKQQSSSIMSRNRPNIEEVNIVRDQSTGLDLFAQDPNANPISSAKKESRHQRKGSKESSKSSFVDVAPPSQLLHSRTSSTHRSGRGSKFTGGGGSVGSASAAQESTHSKVKSQLSMELEQDESIEVIRPYSPTEGGKKTSKGKGKDDVGEAAAIPGKEPARFVAVWDENSKAAKNTQQQQFVNLTNSLAFEAELRPSASLVNTSTEEGRATPVASTTFAPKSFCVTLGLVPDFDAYGGGRSATPVLDELGETSTLKSTSAEANGFPPTFAIPVGFADLVINGDETLDGRRRQIDLPLSSLSNFIRSNGGADKFLEKGSYPFPLIEFTAEGLGAVANSNETKKDAENSTTPKEASGKKKKSIVKRMFSRKQQQSAAATSASEPDRAKSPPRVHSGNPTSIFQLGRPPNSKERTLFLDRYGVDPSGDAVVRVGLEVFPRGSELEKTFRQKHKLRKKAQAASGGRSRSVGRARSTGRPSPSSVDSRTVDTTDSRSLMDDVDEEMLDSDCDDSLFSQSFFTLDSDASHNSWDESTMYTDALSSYNTIGDDSMTYTTYFTEYEKSKSPRSSSRQSPSNFFTNLLSCNGPTACGDVDEEELEELDTPARMPTMPTPFANIDLVASAVASMSMAEPAEEATADSPAAYSPKGKSVHSVTSMDTATRGNNRAISPASMSIKEGGEELTLDNVSPVASKAPPSLDTSTPFIERAATAVTLNEETSPLAVIKQRVNNDDIDELVGQNAKRQQHVDEGHEFTLEDHQSASMQNKVFRYS